MLFKFGTKAETLARLRSKLKMSSVLPSYFFTIDEWNVKKEQILQEIVDFGAAQPLIIRSSSQYEDGKQESMAGAFESCLNIPSQDKALLLKSIENVISSYGENGRSNDQVLIQPMLDNVDISGVIMTHDMELGAPYYVVNYDDESGLTDTITGGVGIQKTVLIYRKTELEYIRSKRIKKVIEATKELESFCGNLPLDIEFVLSQGGTVYILQVRQISLANTWHPVTERRVARKLGYIREFIAQRNKPRLGIYGRKTLLGVMPDWNPAEIIGTSPSPLAASLYRFLITRDVWREARQQMGYYNPQNEELMTLIDHHPYIDVRNSFNSFLPAKLPEKIKHKLVNAWIDRLTANPELHDKVEFAVAQTCVDFAFDLDYEERYSGLLDKVELAEFRMHLWQLTKDCLQPGEGNNSLTSALAMINKLESLDGRQMLNGETDNLERATQLLYQCRQLGTKAFSIIARHAFIAESFLHSASKLNVLSSARIQEFKSSLQTITSNLTSDYNAVCTGELPASTFLHQFGHLRPGTYDITSLRYDEWVDLFSTVSGELKPISESREFQLTPEEKNGLNNLLSKNLYEIDAEQLIQYARTAIVNREHSKFVFTRSLSNALSELTLWGADVGLAKEDIAFLDIESILNLRLSPALEDLDRIMLDQAAETKRSLQAARSLKLSHIISGVDDVYVVPIHRSMPNFITQFRVEGMVILLKQDTPVHTDLAGCIVCIENADPGYDWIFTKNIAALVTKFGGVNSHMAIRCAEFAIPAAIGCGEQVFNRIISNGRAILNCAEKTIKSL
ncbi:pyruvate, phosphate dikinase [Alteromonas sp. MYP5]|uniref:Pyruvate, phosphate dikinase n=1 Tax=Alteromonas ponticola TaxID=2720613 RepID=A0ABX1R307_9ALTE|nr:pyruvate, phosphate dikinase [Alteromonas ponticola]